MAVLEVTARQFREKQKSLFEQADEGHQIVIKRGKKQTYILAPINQYDFSVKPELLEKIELARRQLKEGKVTVCKTSEDNHKFLDSL